MNSNKRAQKVFGVTGWKNSGKTSLVVNLITNLSARGLRVSTLKHAHHHFDIDKPGTDSHKHREAGAREVLIASGNRWALMHEIIEEQEATMDDLLNQMTDVDLVIIEGYKLGDHPKLQVIREANNTDALPESSSNLVALVSDADLNAADYGCEGPVFDLNDVESVANFIVDYCDLQSATQSVL